MATKKPAAPAKKPTVGSQSDANASSLSAETAIATVTDPVITGMTASAGATSAASTASAPIVDSAAASADAQSKIAQRSAIDALQAELDDVRLRHLTARTQLERQVVSLELTIDELRAELAQATANTRELQAQLIRLRGNR